MKTRKRIIIVSTFSGMDLLMLAFMRAWALPGYGLEKNVWAALMHAVNFKYPDGSPVMQFVDITKEEHEVLKDDKDTEYDSALINGKYIRGKRIQEVNGAEIRAEIERIYGKDICIIMLGGPPCQDYCKLNQNKRTGDRNRNPLVFEYLRVLKELNPDLAIMEEAQEFGQPQFAGIFREFMAAAMELNYHVAHMEANSLHYGSNQQRIRRVVMLVNKGLGKMPVFPAPDTVNVKRVRDFLDIDYFHSGNFTDKIKGSGHFMCTVTSGAPAYFIKSGNKYKPSNDELLLCFDINKGEYVIPSFISQQQVRKAIGNSVSVALFHKVAVTLINEVLHLKHVGDSWFEPIDDSNGDAGDSGNTQAPQPVIASDGTHSEISDSGATEQETSAMIEKGFVLYQGPSAINGANIVAIITAHSVNEKTGDMAQLWILNADVEPLEAVKTGAEEAVCGQCKLRHFLRGACYVTVAKEPATVYRAWKNGTYPYLHLEEYSKFSGRGIRFGAYGDPAAIPFSILEELKKHASTTTCYTHQWEAEYAAPLKALSMASVDNMEEYKEANAMGWRTFRVIEPDEKPVEGEILCPNTTHGVQCKDCGLCAGTSIKAKNIAIVVHGANKLKFNANLDYAAWALKNAGDKSTGQLPLQQNKPNGIIRARSKRIISSSELLGMDFESLPFGNRWADFFGYPSPTFNCVIHGKAGEGKSTFALQFAKYLADNFGRTIYISGEEGFSKTFKDKLANTNSSSNMLYVAELKTLNDIMCEVQRGIYKHIFIDSLDCMGIDAEDMRKLRAIYKTTAFITISQSTKAGEMRGSNELKHDADICVDVERGIAITTKNRFKEKDMRFDVFEEMRVLEASYEDNDGNTMLAEFDGPHDNDLKRRRPTKRIPLAKRTIRELYELLKKAVEKENYEQAAQIRDELEHRKKPPQ
jgi:site-specific DNA-cytosine methylase